MQNREYDRLTDYISEKGINIVKSFNSDNSSFSIEEHIKLLAEFHNKVKGYNFHVSKSIPNNLGKEIEKKKVEIKKITRFMEEQNEKKIYDNVQHVLKKAEDTITEINNSGYLELLKRSMNKWEMCIGNSLPSNIQKEKGMSVIDIAKCSYDMVENDGVYFFSKLRKKDYEFDWCSLIKLYCREEQLNENSEKYISALLSYPNQSIRCINRYRLKKKLWSKEDFLKHLKKAIIKDEQSMIYEVKECMN